MKKIIPVVISFISLFILFSGTNSMGADNLEVEGVIFASWWNGEYQTSNADQSLANLNATGANYVGLLGTWYMNTTPTDGEYSKSNTIYPHTTKTPSDADLIHIINDIKSSGRKVFLKLHIRVILSEDPSWADKWTGYINPSNPNEWFANYTTFTNHYAELAQANGVDILCFGTELPTMTGPQYAAQWDSVIDAINARYTGKLTFSSNMPAEYTQITFWDRCDYLGIGPYFSVSAAGIPDPDLDTIVNGWGYVPDIDTPEKGKTIVEKMADWSAENGNKPIIFTELGYCSVDAASYHPWKGTGDAPENWPLQKRCYDALFLALQGKPWFAGVFAWDWLCDPNAGTTGLERREYTPQNKDAEKSLRNFYLGIDIQNVAYIKIVDGYDTEIADGTNLYLGNSKYLYARAYNASNQILGYVPCSWSISNSSIASFTYNDVGFAVLRSIGEGSLTVTAVAGNGRTDSANFTLSQRYLRVPSDYSTINSAMAVAACGDIIPIAAGTYNESVTIKNGVSLIGDAGAKTTIINGGLTLSPGANNNTLIKGLTITNTVSDYPAYGAGITSVNNLVGSPVIRNNIIKNCAGCGININDSYPKIYNNIVEGNLGGGMRFSSGSPEIINNVIKGNSALRGGGIYVGNTSGKIFNNIITNNHATEYGGGIKGWPYPPAAGFEIGYNDVWNNMATLGENNYGSCPEGTGAISTDPLFFDTVDYMLSSSSPCINAGNPATQYNDSDGSRNDMGIYGGQFTDKWILNITTMPWYQNEVSYYTGAASCKMILDYIRSGAGYSTLAQSAIYNYSHAISDNNEMNPAEMDKALGHFDPYDSIVSNWSDIYDSTLDGNPYQGYNYTVDTYDPAAPNAMNEYMRDICHWMAYPVTQADWWLHGPLVARPNTPAAVPVYGGYHWIVVKGYATSENPYPASTTNPWATPDFTVYGLWIKDPETSGLGQDTYKTAAECASYFLPLETNDAYDGLLLQVAEPPAKKSRGNVDIPRPKEDMNNLEFIGAISAGTYESAAPVAMMSLSAASSADKEPLLRKKSWRDLVDANLLRDYEAVAAFDGTKMGKPVLVNRVDAGSRDYYLVPFGKNTKKGFLVSGVIMLDALDGYFKEATWTKTPETFLKTGEKQALSLVRNNIIRELLKELKAVPRKPERSYASRVNKVVQKYTMFLRNMKNADVSLIWEPNSYSLSPYSPYWKVYAAGSVWYVTQNEEIVRIK